jgi:hypothetical protein
VYPHSYSSLYHEIRRRELADPCVQLSNVRVVLDNVPCRIATAFNTAEESAKVRTIAKLGNACIA